MNEIETVQAFLAALAANDIERALGHAAHDVVYQNVPLPPTHGTGALEKQLRGFGKIADAFEVTTHNIAANGSVVLTERTDAFIVRGARIAFWVCGTFEVKGGKITLWRDYFDWAALSAQTVMAIPRAVLGALKPG